MSRPANPHALSLATAWRLSRPGFLAITVVACVLGTVQAYAATGTWSAAAAVVTLVLACLAHAGANVLNDFHDALNGADDANPAPLSPFTGGSRLIQNGQATPAAARRLAWGLLGATVLGGLALILWTGPALLWLGTAGVLLAWSYSAPPLRLMARGVGEWTVGAAWALMVLGADTVQRSLAGASLPWAAGTGSDGLLPVGYGLLISNILLINGVPDAASDARVGKRTLAARLGGARVVPVYLTAGALAHAVAGAAVGGWAWVSMPLALGAAVILYRRHQQPEQLRPAIVLTIATAVVHGLLVSAGLWAGARV